MPDVCCTGGCWLQLVDTKLKKDLKIETWLLWYLIMLMVRYSSRPIKCVHHSCLLEFNFLATAALGDLRHHAINT